MRRASRSRATIKRLRGLRRLPRVPRPRRYRRRGGLHAGPLARDPVIEACKAGKDIYCQKPLSLTIAEGRAMSYAVNKYDRRLPDRAASSAPTDDFRRACELVRNGRIGELQVRSASACRAGDRTTAKTGDHKTARAGARRASITTRWLGPAPEAPYAQARCHVNFRWIYDYSGGQVTDWGGHHPDCAQWGMGTEMTGPIADPQRQGRLPARPALEHGDRVHLRGRL